MRIGVALLAVEGLRDAKKSSGRSKFRLFLPLTQLLFGLIFFSSIDVPLLFQGAPAFIELLCKYLNAMYYT